MRTSEKLLRLLGNRRMFGCYARWLAAKAVGRKALLEIHPGVRIGEWINFSEFWTTSSTNLCAEFSLLRSVRPNLSTPALAVDAGANIGVFTCTLAALGWSVHSFEPFPATFSRLACNVARNHVERACRLQRVALGPTSGQAQFAYQADSPATNHFLPPRQPPSEANAITVEVVTLDEYCACQGIQFIHFLKMDVEGAEPGAIRGARSLLQRRAIELMLIEVCPANLRLLGHDAMELWAEICGVGYEFRRLGRGGEIGSAVKEAAFREIVFENLLVVPRA